MSSVISYLKKINDKKIALCLICKNEDINDILNFITYYKLIGFDNILLYDGSENNTLYNELISEINDGYVIYHNITFKDNIKQNVYKECYETYKNIYEWIAFFDVDEKLILNKHSNIKNYLYQNKIKNCDIIQIDRKTRIMINDDNVVEYVNDLVKCIVHCKNDLFINIKYRYVTNTLNAQGKNIFVSGSGNVVEKSARTNNDFSEVYIEHTHSKSFNNFLLKLKKGNPKENRFNLVCLSYIEEKLKEYFKYIKFSNEHLKQINDIFPDFDITKESIFGEVDLSIKTDIDYVFPYVDDSDEEWYKEYCYYKGVVDYENDTVCGAARYKTYDLLKYKLRSIEKNMPWVRNVYMIVSSPSQIPQWLDTSRVKIVYHKEIIPEELLPTFNSSAIEMFLGNIEGLSEMFLYGNDDFYVLKPIMPYKFFRGNKPLLCLKERNMDAKNKMGVNFVADAFIKNDIDLAKVGTKYENIEKIFQPDHHIKPMLKSKINEIINDNKDIIYSACTRFRDYNNFNQYLFHLYNVFNGNYIPYDRNITLYSFKGDYEEVRRRINESTLFSLDFITNANGNTIDNLFYTVLPHTSQYEIEYKIDYVFPYVDGGDDVWRKEYLKYYRGDGYENDTANGRVRYETFDLLKYKFRTIEKNMPWVRNIYMIVASPSQVPQWLDTSRVKIVYHKEIIPEEFLPTFNSTTIEMFLHNIEGLSEYFLYGNDDTYVTMKITPDMFFRNGKPLLYISERKNTPDNGGVGETAKYQCMNSTKLLFPNEKRILQPLHHIKPMIKSCNKKLFLRENDKIKKSISRFRENKNFNQYIWHFNNIKNGNYYEYKINCCALRFDGGEKCYRLLKKCILKGLSLLSIDFIPNISYNEINKLKNIFEKRFSKPCLFEKMINKNKKNNAMILLKNGRLLSKYGNKMVKK